jgi:DNA-binding phage protein
MERFSMSSKQDFQQAGFLDLLLQVRQASTPANGLLLTPLWAQHRVESAADTGSWQLTHAGEWLLQLLMASQALAQAASDTDLAADELRRYQKFAKPGQPSAHIVQLRQKQAAARQASNIARQAFLKAAAQLVRELNLDVPPRITLEVFAQQWIDRNVPKS